MLDKAILSAGRLYPNQQPIFTFEAETPTPTPKHITIYGIDERLYLAVIGLLIAFIILSIFYSYVVPIIKKLKKRIHFKLTNQHIMVIIVGLLILISIVIYNQTRPTNCFNECLKEKTDWYICHRLC